MKLFFLVIISSFSFFTCRAQKPSIDSSVYGRWPTASKPVISNNGKYTGFRNSFFNGSKLNYDFVVKSVTDDWEIKLNGVYDGIFTSDNSKLLLRHQGDSVGLLDLKSKSIEYLSNISRFEVVRSIGSDLLLYFINSKFGVANFMNLRTGKIWTIPSIGPFWTSPDKHHLIYQSLDSNSDHSRTVFWMDFVKDSIYTVGRFLQTISLPIFDQHCDEVVFTTTDINKRVLCWNYVAGRSAKAELVCSSPISFEGKEFQFSRILAFNKNRRQLSVLLQDAQYQLNKGTPLSNLTLWSYTDRVMPRERFGFNKLDLRAGCDLVSNSLFALSGSDEDVLVENENYQIVRNRNVSRNEIYWNKFGVDSLFVIKKMDGSRDILPIKAASNIAVKDHYIVYYDSTVHNYLSFDILTKRIKNLTKNIITDWFDIGPELGPSLYATFGNGMELGGIGGWIEDTAVLIYDRYDIWKISIAGKIPPINITNGYGRKNRIVFRLLSEQSALVTIPVGASVILTAFNTKNKSNGFFRLGSLSSDPRLLAMGPYTFYAPQKKGSIEGMGMVPIKADSSDAYILSKQSATQSPNFVFTKDFISFKSLSSIAYEKSYNWISNELISWKTPGGIETQGILYKPENFDSSKRYPLIFDIYELRSNELNSFRVPDWTNDRIDIPTYVSNGYLVFTPDIYYKKDKPLQSLKETIVSAVNKLSRFPFIDLDRLGLQGHSWGGFEANYLLTHTNVFRAICSASGNSDLISLRGTFYKGSSETLDPETMQFRSPGVLWNNTEWYVKNSPLMAANMASAPLLIMHTTNDPVCPFSQAIEFFTALRRLGKKVWMLEYKDGAHSVFGASAVDYTVRTRQFFDHYLKGMPLPKWMIDGSIVQTNPKNYDLAPIGTEESPGLAKK